VDETNNDRPRQRKVLLDISLFALNLLDPDKTREEAATGTFSVEVPGALVTMIQKAKVGDPELLLEFLYAYLLKRAQYKKHIKFLSGTKKVKQELKEEAKRAVERIIREYAPLIEGAVEQSSELSAQESPSAEDESTGESSHPESSERPETPIPRYPIRSYKALTPVKPEVLTKLRHAYIEVLNLPANELFDIYFLQVFHSLRYGVSASPEVQRQLVAVGRLPFEVLSRFICSTIGGSSRHLPDEELEGPAQNFRDFLFEFAPRFLRDELLGAVSEGLYDLTISFILTASPEVVPVLVVVSSTLFIRMICAARLTPELRSLLVAAWLILVVVTLLLAILLLHRYQETRQQTLLSGSSCPQCPPSVVYVIPPTAIVPAAVPPPAPMQFTQPPESGVCIYVVQPGDTPQAIAARFQVSEDTLRATNPTLGIGVFRIHQKLMISAPCCRPIGRQGISHTVQRRETLYNIARRYGTTLESIAWANHIYDLNYIQEGQMLCIP
jgi:LysM repeat protein